MLRLCCGLLLGILISTSLLAQPSFPKLSGQVVDTANLLDSSAKQRITSQLQAHTNATGNQIVVVTVPDLQGYGIETFGYQLGRHWEIGQKGKNNGVLLIIAKAERSMRIEVGYGLEGTLTDAISANIIQTILRPAFKRGQFEQGIEAGTTAIIAALGGQYSMRKASSGKKAPTALVLLIFIIIIAMNVLRGGGGPGFGRRYGSGHYYGGGLGSGGFGGGGGFSGGGGSFGGGGASGGW